ncbi:MAG: hypothetical protein L3J04_07190 [Robiginitomaculum sp.]|nr:hypothetical protein [Robiginitomaculum sp.]
MARIVKAKPLAGVLLAAALAGCQPAPLETVIEPTPTPIFSAGSIGPINGGISTLALAPNATIPWEGRLLIAPNSGGIQVYSVEGTLGFKHEGQLYTSMALQPGFDLRNLKTGLLLAVTKDKQLVSLIIDDARGQVFPAPVSNLPTADTNAVCTLHSPDKAPLFAVLRRNSDFEIWKIEDTGADTLQATKISSATLKTPIEGCSSVNEQVFATGLSGGVFTVDISGKPVITHGIDRPNSKLIAIAINDKTAYILHSSKSSNVLQQITPDMQQTASLHVAPSLSIPAITQPGAMAISNWSFGGAGFSAGLLAIADNDNNRVSLIVRDTLPGFDHDQEDR